jgi:hypothetical protein
MLPLWHQLWGGPCQGVSVSWQTAALGVLLAAALLLDARCSVYMYMAAAWCCGVDSLLPSGHEHAPFDYTIINCCALCGCTS